MTAATAAERERLAAVAAYDIIGVDHNDPAISDLTGLCELAATLMGCPSAVVNLLDDRFEHQVAAFGAHPAPRRRDESLGQITLAAGADVCVADASADDRFATSPWVDGRLASIRFYCSTILRSPAGHAIGTLCVFGDLPRLVTDQQRRAIGALARQVVDVLELRLRTRQLEQATQELTRSQDRLAAFAGQVSHDLKAPITAILGFSELLADLDPIVEDPSAVAYVGRCSSAAKRMLAMIDDLLAYARVGGSQAPVPIALGPLVADIVTDLGAAAADAQVSASGPDVVADEAQFRALLQNLIGNAVTYRSEAPCVVEVSSERVGEQLLVRVVDNGSGIPPENRADVLRPLVRLRKDVPGAGLGLAVCVRVVAAHGGSLRLDGAAGGGTAAIVTLPA